MTGGCMVKTKLKYCALIKNKASFVFSYEHIAEI